MSDTAFIILVLIIAFGIIFGIAYWLSTKCFLRVSPETLFSYTLSLVLFTE